MRAAERRRQEAVLALLVLAAYAASLSAPVFYDDAVHVLRHPLNAAPLGATLRALVSRDYFALAAERTCQPFVTLLHRLLWDAPRAYRLLGFALHAFNAALVLRVGRRLVAPRAAFLGAALFALYPPLADAVFFSSFKGHLIACAFSLLTLDAWLEGKTWRVAAFYALALLSKESGMAAAGLCALAWACLGRPRMRAAWAALAAETALYLSYRFAWLHPPPAFPETFARPVLASLAWALRTLVWPWPQCLERALAGGPWVWTTVAAFAAAAWALRARPQRLLLLLAAAAAYGPFLHLVAFANVSPVADRYLYLPAAAFFLLAADLLPAPACAAVLLAFGVSTARRAALYRDPHALFAQTAACAPANPRARFLFGASCLERGENERAEEQLRAGLALRESAGFHALLGEALWREGRKDEAREHFLRARALDPGWAARFPEQARRLEPR